VIEKAPRLSDEQNRIVGRVANLKEEKRMIQILDAHELVSDVDHASLTNKVEATTSSVRTEKKTKKSRPEKDEV
jgi:hypothetical protein